MLENERFLYRLGGGKRQRPGSGESPRNGELKSQKSGPPFKKGKGNIQTMECSNSALQTLSGYESDSPTKSQVTKVKLEY